eukprot:5728678-Prymnesium_polylepis.1
MPWRTHSTCTALAYFVSVLADRRPSLFPIDARPPHDHHPVFGEEPRMRGRPGCMRARLMSTALSIALPPRVPLS